MHQSNEDAISSSKKPHPSPRGDNIKVKKHKFRTCSPSPGVIIIRKTAYKYQLSLRDNNYPLHVQKARGKHYTCSYNCTDILT